MSGKRFEKDRDSRRSAGKPTAARVKPYAGLEKIAAT